MPVDATGTPTALGIPTFNVDADAPSGLGFNAAMQEIDALITGRMLAPTAPGTGDVPVWNGTSWVKSSTKHFAVGGIDAAGIPDGQAVKAVGGVATWGVVSPTVWQFAPATIFSGAGYVAGTLTSVFSQAIPGGTLGSTKRLRVIAFGDYLNNSGAGTTQRWQVNWGGAAIYDEAATVNLASGAQRRPWRLELDLAASTDTGHQSLSGRLEASTATAVPTVGEGQTTPGADPISALIASAGPVAVDSTASQTLEVKVSAANSNANIDFKLWHAMILVEG